MKVLEKRFKWIDWGDWQSGNKFSLCGSEFSELFDVPESVKTIWLSLHTRPAKDRVKIQIVPYKVLPSLPDFTYQEPGMSLGSVTNMTFHFYGELKKLIGKTLYLQCEY